MHGKLYRIKEDGEQVLLGEAQNFRIERNNPVSAVLGLLKSAGVPDERIDLDSFNYRGYGLKLSFKCKVYNGRKLLQSYKKTIKIQSSPVVGGLIFGREIVRIKKKRNVYFCYTRFQTVKSVKVTTSIDWPLNKEETKSFFSRKNVIDTRDFEKHLTSDAGKAQLLKALNGEYQDNTESDKSPDQKSVQEDSTV